MCCSARRNESRGVHVFHDERSTQRVCCQMCAPQNRGLDIVSEATGSSRLLARIRGRKRESLVDSDGVDDRSSDAQIDDLDEIVAARATVCLEVLGVEASERRGNEIVVYSAIR